MLQHVSVQVDNPLVCHEQSPISVSLYLARSWQRARVCSHTSDLTAYTAFLERHAHLQSRLAQSFQLRLTNIMEVQVLQVCHAIGPRPFIS